MTRITARNFLTHLTPLVVRAGFSAVLGGVIVMASWLGWAMHDLPDVARLWTDTAPPTYRIYDRHGQLLTVKGNQTPDPVDISALPGHVTSAIISIEDRRFYKHMGVDLRGLARAALANRKAGRVVQGGSTLTQQLAKNLFLSPERTFKRKSQELLLALWLEARYSKDEILSLYLSRVYFGSGAYGIEAASETYFGKAPDSLTLGEAALLAGLLKAPSRDNPVTNIGRAEARTKTVLDTMVETGEISAEDRQSVFDNPIALNRTQTDSAHLYFTDWIMDALEASGNPMDRDLYIYTTLDSRANTLAAAALRKHLDPERGAQQGAIISLNGSGEILAMIGGADYAASTFNRAAYAKRQPGSAFKPFVYATALENGWRPEDTLIDAPLDIDGWSPGNFDNKWHGEITVKDAFAKSLNGIAVQLSEHTGRERVAGMGARFGLSGLKPYRSLALGAQDVTPLELTQSYIPFTGTSRARRAFGITSVQDATGHVIYAPPEQSDTGRVMQPANMAAMTHLFENNVQHGTGTRAAIEGIDVGGKTGTTNDYRDAWFMGFVSDQITGVWVGHDDNLPMQRITGGSIPADIWHDMMAPYLEGQHPPPLMEYTPDIRPREDLELQSLLSDVKQTLKAGETGTENTEN